MTLSWKQGGGEELEEASGRVSKAEGCAVNGKQTVVKQKYFGETSDIEVWNNKFDFWGLKKAEQEMFLMCE